jgi:hypothetical protein
MTAANGEAHAFAAGSAVPYCGITLPYGREWDIGRPVYMTDGIACLRCRKQVAWELQANNELCTSFINAKGIVQRTVIPKPTFYPYRTVGEEIAAKWGNSFRGDLEALIKSLDVAGQDRAMTAALVASNGRLERSLETLVKETRATNRAIRRLLALVESRNREMTGDNDPP